MLRVVRWYHGLATTATVIQTFLLLAMRLFWGFAFLSIGLAKLRDPVGTATYFASVGIPLSHYMAYFVGAVEAGGGACLILGFLSRIASLFLIFTMIAAYLITAFPSVKHILSDPETFLTQPPFTFLLVSLVIFAFGPGVVSLDFVFGWIYRKIAGRGKTAETK